MNMLKSRLIRHYLPLAITSVLTGIVFHLIWPKKDFITLLADASGYLAIVIIVISLIIGSVNILLKRKNPTSTYLRRDIGITAGILTVIHSISGLFVHLRGNMWQYFSVKTDSGFSIRLDDFGLANYTGLLSTLLIIVLLVTSNDYSLSKLKATTWKNIQRLSYLMFIFAIIHVVYYRIVMTNLDLIYYFYIPILAVVFIFQGAGLFVKIRQNE